MTDKELLEICLNLVEKKFDHGERSTWTNFHAEKLATLISETTEMSISTSTIHRLFLYRKYSNPDYVPQEATKLTFAKFLGFNSWHQFKDAVILNGQDGLNGDGHIKNEMDTKNEQYLREKPETHANERSKKKTLIEKIVLSFVFLLLGISGTYWVMVSNKSLTNTEMGLLIHAPEKPNNAPEWITFSCNLSKLKDVKGFSVISFKDGDYDLIHQERTTIKHLYKTPGFYMPAIYYGDRMLAETKVYIENKKWFVEILQNEKTFTLPFFSKNVLFFQKDTLSTVGLDTSKYFKIQYMHFNKINASGDDFSLNAEIDGSSSDGKLPAKEFEFDIFGDKGNHHSISFYNKAYTNNDIFCRLSDKMIYNNEDMLNNFIINTNLKNKIELKIKNKNVSVFINNVSVFSSSYQSSMGNIVGIKIGCVGVGKCRDIEIINEKGRKVFDSNKM